MDVKFLYRIELNQLKGILTGLLLGLFLVLSGCHSDSFWNINGPITSEIRQLQEFSIINLNNNINLTFKPDSFDYIIINAEEKFLPQIKSTVINDSLYLANLNKDYRLRNYDNKINAELHFSKPFLRFYLNGSGDLISQDTLFLTSCEFIGIRSSGKVDLLVNCNYLGIGLYVFQNSSDFRIRGHTQSLRLFTRGTGISDFRDFIAVKARIYNQGTNDCYVNATENLHLEIQNTGNIYYKGSSLLSVQILKDGEGNAIPY